MDGAETALESPPRYGIQTAHSADHEGGTWFRCNAEPMCNIKSKYFHALSLSALCHNVCVSVCWAEAR